MSRARAIQVLPALALLLPACARPPAPEPPPAAAVAPEPPRPVPVEDDAIPPPRPVVRPVKPVDDESLADRGRELFFKLQCGACHTEAAGARGPALTGLFGTRVNLKGGGAVVADDAYIAESIRRPRAKVVEGWSPVMPLYDTDRVSDDEVRAIVAFVKARKRGDPVPKGEHFPPPVGSPVERSEPAPRPREK